MPPSRIPQRRHQDFPTIVIPLSDADISTIGDLSQFHQAVQTRLSDLGIIFVSERGVPLVPRIPLEDIPNDAIWVPKIDL